MHVFVSEAQADQNSFRFAFDAVASEQGQTVVQIVQLDNKFLVLWAFVIGAVGQFLLQAFRVVFQLVVFIKGGEGFVQNGLRAVYVLFLRQISDGMTFVGICLHHNITRQRWDQF